MKPEEAYDLVVNLDRRVRIRPDMPSPTPRGAGNQNPTVGAPPPVEYTRWAERATDDEVDQFWFLISEGNWKKAKQISGLPTSVITDILASFHDTGDYMGRTRVTAYVMNGKLPLHRFLYLLRIAPNSHAKYYDRYINNTKAPPYNALPKRAREAFEYLARVLEREVDNG